MRLKRVVIGLLVAATAVFAAPAQAVTIGGVEFPEGVASFADAVTSYAPVLRGSTPVTPYRRSSNALGAPNYAGSNACSSQARCPFVTLGSGGGIVLRFDDNRLTGSGDSALDLWVFEVGPDVEDTFIEISKDGETWLSVGAVGGSTSGIDIDAYGATPGDRYRFVRLTDDATEGAQRGNIVGADIDAVGAISTVLTPPPPPAPVPVPEPSALWLLAGGFATLVIWRLRASAKHGQPPVSKLRASAT